MKDTFKKILNHRMSALAIAAFCAAAAPATINAVSGPNRASYETGNPPAYAVFNSMSNNFNYNSNETDFVQACVVGTASDPNGHYANLPACNISAPMSNGWTTQAGGNTITVEDGKQYFVRVYVHNNGWNPLDQSTVVAHGVNSSVNGWASGFNTSYTLTGNVGWTYDSTHPNTQNPGLNLVQDDITFTSAGNRPFELTYVPGSAYYYTLNQSGGAFRTGVQLPDAAVTGTGTPLGYTALDGNIPGCFEYSGYMLMLVQVEMEPEPCPWNPELPIDDPGCYEPCPLDPELPIDDPGCVEPEPCPYNPELLPDDPNCYPPCPSNPNLPADSPDCKEPELPVLPVTGTIPAVIGMGGLGGAAAITTAIALRRKRK